jgi:asparagine N-glycosylation enzyme membrane subunit Stt3
MSDHKELIDYIKDFLLKNNFVSSFSVLSLLFLFFSLLSYFNYSDSGYIFASSFSFLTLFSSFIWFLLFLSFVISTILAYYEKYNLMFLPFFMWLLFTSTIVRTSNLPLLKNAATGEWGLGPDLDPYLFLRHAREIMNGENMGELDNMRYAPLGAKNFIHGNIMPRSIVFVYNVINLFGDYSVTYAAIISPVIFFLISIIGLFLFCYFTFSLKFSKKKSLIISSVASFLYAFAPQMLHRTAAGIPELESLGIMWYWFAFLFFVLAWREKKVKRMVLYGLLSGLFTGLMSLSWGGYRYIYMTIGLVVLFCFFFNTNKKKNLIILFSFLFSGIFIEFFKLNSINSILMNFESTGFVLIVFFFVLVDLLLYGTRIKDKLNLDRFKLPSSVISIFVSLLVIFLILLVFDYNLLVSILSGIIKQVLTPFGSGRVGLTVAENKSPYFMEVFNNYGYLFWMFFFGVIVLFYEAIKHFDLKNKIILNSFFIFYLFSFIFSRISTQSVFNGENFISMLLYFGGLILFGVVLLFIYIKAYVNNDKKTISDFKRTGFTYFLLIGFAFWAIVSMRGTIRLFFIITPTLIIISSYLLVKLFDYTKSKDSVLRIIFYSSFILAILVVFFSVVNYSQATVNQAKYIAPSAYNQQWHHAMHWVEQNTSEGAIFTHWWDYGYWVQTLGKRPTVSDGGHYIDWWDHTIGRYLLTTPNPNTALSLLKSHNVSYLLIDSTDLGKYSAYSSIGSDENGGDRLSWIPVLSSDLSQVQETANGTIRIYQSGTYLDGDIVYEVDGREVILLESRDAIGAIILEYVEVDGMISVKQPKAAFVNYKNQRFDIPLRYLYHNDEMIDYGSGLNMTVRIIPSIIQGQQGIQIDPLGAAIFLSEKTTSSLFAQLYLMDDPFDNYPTIELAHVEDDAVVKNLKGQGADFGEFVYYQGFRGPIKIWDTREIPEDILFREEFLWMINPDGNWAALDDLEFRR